MAHPAARVLMVRSCEWNDNTAKTWDVKVLEPDAGLPEDLKRAILGTRRRIVFVEGTSGSLDLPIYTALFPDISVVPTGSCVDVERAVTGLRESLNYHHVGKRINAFFLDGNRLQGRVKEVQAGLLRVNIKKTSDPNSLPRGLQDIPTDRISTV